MTSRNVGTKLETRASKGVSMLHHIKNAISYGCRTVHCSGAKVGGRDGWISEWGNSCMHCEIQLYHCGMGLSEKSWWCLPAHDNVKSSCGS